jgi:hypothetical protein
MSRRQLISPNNRARVRPRIAKLSSRARSAQTVFERAAALGYKAAFPTPQDAQAFIDAHGDQPRDDHGRWTK